MEEGKDLLSVCRTQEKTKKKLLVTLDPFFGGWLIQKYHKKEQVMESQKGASDGITKRIK